MHFIVQVKVRVKARGFQSRGCTPLGGPGGPLRGMGGAGMNEKKRNVAYCPML